MKLTKNLKKAMAVLLAVVILLAALPITTVSAAEYTVYPGGQIRVTYSFVKDISEGVPCYLINSDYDANSLKFADIENYWVAYPVCVPHAEYISFNAAVPIGPTIKAGDKIAGLIFDVVNPVDVNSLNFNIWELQLYNNAEDDLMENEIPSTYVSYNVEVVSRGENPETSLLYGDVDQDGIISIPDATMIQKFGVGMINAPEAGSDLFKIADVNEDGDVSILDSTCIQKYLLGGYEDTGLLGR